jgi:hypothetical protein
LPLGKRAADPELIRDRCVALIVRRVPRVNPNFHDFTSVDNRRLAAQLGLEDLACRLPREHAYERAKCGISSAINGRRRTATRVRRNSSSSPALSASSFGHDTPAHVERRSWFAGVVVATDGRH